MSKLKHIPGHNMPKLGWADQLIYWALIIPTLLFSLFCLIIAQWAQERVAFADHRVIAATIGEGNLSCFFLMFWCMAVYVILLAGFWQRRIPLWGRKDIAYGPPKYPPIYPLLRKDFRKQPLTSRQKRHRTLLVLAALLTFLFSAAMFPRSFYGRAVMLEDGTIDVYNATNNLTQHYTAAEILEVRLDTYAAGKYGGDWTAEMVVYTQDQEQFRFATYCFAGDELQQLQTMLSMKIQYASLVIMEGDEDLDKVIHDQYSGSNEQALLLELFRK